MRESCSRAVPVAAAAAVLVLGPVAAWPAAFYKTTVIWDNSGRGTLRGAPRITEGGLVSGIGVNNGATSNIVSYTWTSKKGLALLPGVLPTYDAFGEDVNGSGRVAGWVYLFAPGQEYRWRAFVWNTVKRTALDLTPALVTALPGLTGSMAYGINGPGEVVGEYLDSDYNRRGLYWHPQSGARALPELQKALRINGAGRIIGLGSESTTPRPAYVVNVTGGKTRLPDPGGGGTVPTAINEKGDVVGYTADAAGNRRAFIWNAKAGMVDLGDLGGGSAVASDINEEGFVVGSSRTPSGAWHAFVTDIESEMYDLSGMVSSEFAWVLDGAVAINNRGVIVCSATSKASVYNNAWVLLGRMQGPFSPWPEGPPSPDPW